MKITIEKIHCWKSLSPTYHEETFVTGKNSRQKTRFFSRYVFRDWNETSWMKIRIQESSASEATTSAAMNGKARSRFRKLTADWQARAGHTCRPVDDAGTRELGMRGTRTHDIRGEGPLDVARAPCAPPRVSRRLARPMNSSMNYTFSTKKTSYPKLVYRISQLTKVFNLVVTF